MERGFYQIYVVLAVAASFAITFFAIRGVTKKSTRIRKKFVLVIEGICEFLFVGVFPGIGISITNDKCDTHPFELGSINTAYTLWIIFAFGYLLSRYFKKQLSPIAILIVAAALVGGAAFCLAICIHFLPMIFAVIFPGFGLLYLSPFLSLLFLTYEIIRLNKFLKEKLNTSDPTAVNKINVFNNWLKKYHLGFTVFLAIPITLAIQAVLHLFGQRADSIIYQFTDSCGYLLSKYQECSCGGDHYLCSIAANGNKKLVKPTRFGVRANEKIVVNRQLLIANAFENWLEDYTPRLHKVVRHTYDSMGIPVNKWSKHKHFANILYLLMKPLEWLFLLWLYLLDTKPENRIAKQYLPKKELNEFLNSN
ncbi:MAG: DUF6688 family protein [Bacteroidota bacterium]|nr:DUF6688 family protein [Bacteroidota bacterium]